MTPLDRMVDEDAERLVDVPLMTWQDWTALVLCAVVTVALLVWGPR